MISLLAPERACGQIDAYRRLEKEFLDNYWRFRVVRCIEDFRDLEAFRARFREGVDPQGLSGKDWADYLCLDLLVRKGIARVHCFDRLDGDPGMALPSGDIFDRAMKDEGVGGVVRDRIRRYLLALAGRLENAPLGWDRVKKRYAGQAIKGAESLRLSVGEFFLLLLPNLPHGERESWKAVAVRLVKAIDMFRLGLEAVHASLPDPTEEEERSYRKAEMDFSLRYDLLLDCDADELLERGVRFFLDTIAELEREAKRVGGGRSWQEILRESEEDHAPLGKLVDWAGRAAKNAVRFVEEKDLMTLPRKGRVFDVVAGNPDGPTPFAHYRPGGKKNKAAYVVVPCGEKWSEDRVRDHLRANNIHWLQVVSLHEAVPGHHLQFTIAAGIKSPIRRRFRCPAYFEGWALYCEEMMGRHGYYKSKARLTQLRMRLWRAARVLSAVGQNHNGLSEEDAARMLCDKVMFKDMHAKREAKMHRGRPVYFCCYSIGYWQITKLRMALMKKWGEAYSEKGFHDAFLSLGPIPVPIVAKVLLADDGLFRGKRTG